MDAIDAIDYEYEDNNLDDLILGQVLASRMDIEFRRKERTTINLDI